MLNRHERRRLRVGGICGRPGDLDPEPKKSGAVAESIVGAHLAQEGKLPFEPGPVKGGKSDERRRRSIAVSAVHREATERVEEPPVDDLALVEAIAHLGQ